MAKAKEQKITPETEEKTTLETEVEQIEKKQDLDWLAKHDPQALMKIKKTIMLPRATGKQNNFVYVGLNGASWQIMRGVPVEVPLPVAEILEESMRAENRAADYVDSLQQVE